MRRHDPDRALSAWLEDGPNELPEMTRRAIDVGVRTTRQARRGWLRPWSPAGNPLRSPYLVGALALLFALGSLYLSRPGAAGLPGGVGAGRATSRGVESPASSPPRSAAVPDLTEPFTSAIHGYALVYPDGWRVRRAETPWWPPDWKQRGAPETSFDWITSPLESRAFRAASVAAPRGVSIDDWIDEYMTFSDQPGCAPARVTLPEIVIDGRPGRVRDSCDEVEATVVVGQRVYLFTLFALDGELDGQSRNARALFDEFAATIDLRPAAAVASPTPPR